MRHSREWFIQIAMTTFAFCASNTEVFLGTKNLVKHILFRHAVNQGIWNDGPVIHVTVTSGLLQQPALRIECGPCIYSHLGIISTMDETQKPLYWIASAKKDLRAMPEDVQDVFGFALHLAQEGKKHDKAKPRKGFGGANVLEVVEDCKGDTYRAAYTVKLANSVYVLHCFQKKSKQGIATPKPDLDFIRERLKAAEAHAKGVEK